MVPHGEYLSTDVQPIRANEAYDLISRFVMDYHLGLRDPRAEWRLRQILIHLDSLSLIHSSCNVKHNFCELEHLNLSSAAYNSSRSA